MEKALNWRSSGADRLPYGVSAGSPAHWALGSSAAPGLLGALPGGAGAEQEARRRWLLSLAGAPGAHFTHSRDVSSPAVSALPTKSSPGVSAALLLLSCPRRHSTPLLPPDPTRR